MNSYEPTAEYAVETVSRNFKMPSMHYHDAYEVYFLEAGSRDYFVEDKLFSVSAGEFVLIPPGKLHRTGGEFCVRTLVHFTESFLLRTFHKNVIEDLLRCFAHVKIIPNARQQEQCRQYLKQLAGSEDPAEFALVLALLLKELDRCGNEVIRYGQVGSIVAYINQNYPSIHTIEDIAEHFYISKFHLCRVFKSAMQMTIIEYLNQVRIKNARQLLELSDRDVGEIADLCGFRSVAYFSNFFKKTTAESPTEYRKRIRGK